MIALVTCQLFAGIVAVAAALRLSRALWFEGMRPAALRPAAHVLCGLGLLAGVITLASLPILGVAAMMTPPIPAPADDLFLTPVAGVLVFLYRVARLVHRERGLKEFHARMAPNANKDIPSP